MVVVEVEVTQEPPQALDGNTGGSGGGAGMQGVL